jgi:hypothetical protein
MKANAMPVVIGAYFTGELLASLAVTGMTACGLYSLSAGEPSPEGKYTPEQEKVILADFMTLPNMLIREGIVTEDDLVYELCKALSLGVLPDNMTANNAVSELIRICKNNGIDLANRYWTNGDVMTAPKEFFKAIIDSFANVLSRLDVKTLEKYDIQLKGAPWECHIKLTNQVLATDMTNINNKISELVSNGYNYVIYGSSSTNSFSGFALGSNTSFINILYSKNNFIYNVTDTTNSNITDSSGGFFMNAKYDTTGCFRDSDYIKNYNIQFLFYYKNMGFTASALSLIGQPLMPSDFPFKIPNENENDKEKLPGGLKVPNNEVKPYIEVLPDQVTIGDVTTTVGPLNAAVTIPIGDPTVNTDPEKLTETIGDNFKKTYPLIESESTKGLDTNAKNELNAAQGNPSYDPLNYKTSGMASKFPFCIPYDLVNCIRVLAAKPEAPYVSIPIKNERLGWNNSINIDFSKFESIAAICRYGETLMFIGILITKTRGLIKG